MPPDATDANENFRRAFLRLPANTSDGVTREFGSLTAAVSGLPVAVYNRLFVFERPDRDDLGGAVDWLKAQDVPFWVTVSDPVLADAEALMADVGLVRSGESNPGMVRSALDDIPQNQSPAAIAEVTDAEALADFVTVATAVFGVPRDVTEQVYRAASRADGIRLFTGRVDGQAVACGMLIRTDDVAGVYTIGVEEAFRQQGIGEAMTWAVLRAGRDDGCRVGTLQSSDMAYSLYESMGFERVLTYHHLEPAQ